VEMQNNFRVVNYLENLLFIIEQIPIIVNGFLFIFVQFILTNFRFRDKMGLCKLAQGFGSFSPL
jgi:hypothetical protein